MVPGFGFIALVPIHDGGELWVSHGVQTYDFVYKKQIDHLGYINLRKVITYSIATSFDLKIASWWDLWSGNCLFWLLKL